MAYIGNDSAPTFGWGAGRGAVAASLVGLLVVVGCGSAQVSGMRPVHRPASYEPADGHARVVFLRSGGHRARDELPVFAEDHLVGIARGRMQFAVEVTPGEHRFYSWAENEDGVHLELEAGRTYFVLVRTEVGWTEARVVMEVVDRAHPAFPELGQILQTLPMHETDERAAEAWLARDPQLIRRRLRAAQAVLASMHGGHAGLHTGSAADGLLPEELASMLPVQSESAVASR